MVSKTSFFLSLSLFKPADSVGGVIPIETCVAVCPSVTAISPTILTRSLQKFQTIKNRYSPPRLMLGVTIRQIFSHFWPKNVQKIFMWVIMQDFKAHGYFLLCSARNTYRNKLLPVCW